MLIRKPLAVACLVVAPVAWSQESGNVEGEAELGILLTSGNTEETKVNGRLALKHETTMWRNTGEFSSRYTEADEETTAEEYQVALESTTSSMSNNTGLSEVPGKTIVSPVTNSSLP